LEAAKAKEEVGCALITILVEDEIHPVDDLVVLLHRHLQEH
jgi:hypothetical protein